MSGFLATCPENYNLRQSQVLAVVPSPQTLPLSAEAGEVLPVLALLAFYGEPPCMLAASQHLFACDIAAGSSKPLGRTVEYFASKTHKMLLRVRATHAVNVTICLIDSCVLNNWIYRTDHPLNAYHFNY